MAAIKATAKKAAVEKAVVEKVVVEKAVVEKRAIENVGEPHPNVIHRKFYNYHSTISWRVILDDQYCGLQLCVYKILTRTSSWWRAHLHLWC